MRLGLLDSKYILFLIQISIYVYVSLTLRYVHPTLGIYFFFYREKPYIWFIDSLLLLRQSDNFSSSLLTTASMLSIDRKHWYHRRKE